MKKISIITAMMVIVMIMSACSGGNTRETSSTDSNIESDESVVNKEKETELETEQEEKEKEEKNVALKGDQDKDTDIIEKKESDFASINDVNKIYDFLKKNITNLTKEDFEANFTPYYLDINQDGNLDVCYNTKEWYGDLIYILSTQGGYQIIKSDHSDMHKINTVNLVDDFVVVTGENIDNGYGDQRTDVYYFTGDKIKYLDQFKTYLFSGAQTYYEGKGNLHLLDGYKDLEYTYDQFYYDKNGNEEHRIHIALSYLFDETTLSYTKSEIDENFDYMNHNNDNDKKHQDRDTSHNEEDHKGAKAQNIEDINKEALVNSSGNHYYEFKTDTNIYFDMDQDGTNEEIKYDLENSKLIINGYEPIDIYLTQGYVPESFTIINYSDHYITRMNMIAIFDPRPSADPVTTFYAILESGGKKELTKVGSITAELIPASQYNDPYDVYDFSNRPSTDYLEQSEDFMQKAFLVKDVGIDAPVMLTTEIPQIWFGRSLFTYNTSYESLVDTCSEYGEEDYRTFSVLEVLQDIKVYDEKNSESEYKVIKSGQNVLLQATDNALWISMRAEDGTEGWVNINDVTHDNFDGFVIFG